MNGDPLAVKARNPVRIDGRGMLAACWFVKDGTALNLCSSRAAAKREVGLARSHVPADSLLFLNWNAVGALAEQDSGFFRMFTKATAGTVPDGKRHRADPSN